MPRTFGDTKDRQRYLKMADKARISFNEVFWNDAEECLFDVINGDEKDASVRPNQIFAVSLPNAILDFEKARKVVEKVEIELLTPFGLRTLSPRDKNYCPIYIGFTI
ncbi:MAG: amylo-alpha-1,6-glucosidase [Pyrinomonadaceae bacterium]